MPAEATGIHAAAATGFGRAADAYANCRPNYPSELEGWLRNTLGLGPGKTALDLGAGTGEFTPRLVATGARVIAVEPVEAMRLRLAAGLPDILTKAGTAENITETNASVDAVLCAQAFHWFSTASALDEIGRVLRPGGHLGLAWNSRDTSVGWVRAIAAIVERYEGDAPRFHSGNWRKAFPHPLFGSLQETRFLHVHVGPVEQVVVNRMLSVSFMASLPPAEQAKVAAELRAVVARTPELSGKAEIAFPYVTYAYAAQRLG